MPRSGALADGPSQLWPRSRCVGGGRDADSWCGALVDGPSQLWPRSRCVGGGGRDADSWCGALVVDGPSLPPPPAPRPTAPGGEAVVPRDADWPGVPGG
eukprot:scaffold57613_cov37-Phaeocystis_antarctica.AAC.3